MVTVGDQHVVRLHGGADGAHPLGIGDALDAVLDAIDGHRSDRLAGCGQQLGEATAQRQPPDRREVGAGRPREVEAIGGRLRCRAFVGEHAARTLVDDLQATEHAGDVALAAGGVDEPHPVDRERRPIVGDEHTGGDPAAEPFAGVGVPTVTVAFAGHVDVHDVVTMAGGEGVDVSLRQHVVGGRDHVVETSRLVGGVAECGKGLESGHTHRLAGAPACYNGQRDDLRRGRRRLVLVAVRAV